ncbi:MAG: hypothetical protein HDR75_10760 [Bacteroides sp.]|nr:hypothetical protein [Bacteroides sp.]
MKRSILLAAAAIIFASAPIAAKVNYQVVLTPQGNSVYVSTAGPAVPLPPPCHHHHHKPSKKEIKRYKKMVKKQQKQAKKFAKQQQHHHQQHHHHK